jgi:hypothetical protein
MQPMEWMFALGVMGLCVVSRGFRILTFVVIGIVAAPFVTHFTKLAMSPPQKQVACVDASNPYCKD